MSEEQRAAEQLHKASQYMAVLAAVLRNEGHAVAAHYVSEEAKAVHEHAASLVTPEDATHLAPKGK